jgi:hypothetical protein
MAVLHYELGEACSIPPPKDEDFESMKKRGDLLLDYELLLDVAAMCNHK